MRSVAKMIRRKLKIKNKCKLTLSKVGCPDGKGVFEAIRSSIFGCVGPIQGRHRGSTRGCPTGSDFPSELIDQYNRKFKMHVNVCMCGREKGREGEREKTREVLRARGRKDEREREGERVIE